MVEPVIQITLQNLKNTVDSALNRYLPRRKQTCEQRVELYEKSLREADEQKHRLVKIYNAELDAQLIFAGLVSAVASAFILGIQTQLQPGTNPNPQVDPHIFFYVQRLLFSSLAASLLAALAVVSGKEWLDFVDTPRSCVDHDPSLPHHSPLKGSWLRVWRAIKKHLNPNHGRSKVDSESARPPDHPDIQAVLYENLAECFSSLFGRSVVIPKFQDKAYFSAKALLRVAVQCKSKDNESEAFNSISKRHKDMGVWYCGGDSDLESTLGIIDRVLKVDGFKEIPWDKFSNTYPHHEWISEFLVERASSALTKEKKLPDDVKEFILYSFRLNPLPPLPIVSDCLRIISLVLKIGLDANDQQVTHNSQQIRSQIHRIYEELTTTFKKSNPTVDEVKNALEALAPRRCGPP